MAQKQPSLSRRFRMLVAYDGTAYAGWQVQPRHITIQSEIERVLREISGGEVRVQCSGRTDAGVHARAQPAHFDLQTDIEPRRLKTALNALLPEDIRILSLLRAAPDFHARFNATSKEYRYFIWNAEVVPPFLRHYRLHVRKPLDIAGMKRAAARLVGEHDFAAFSANPNREIDGTVRTLHDLRVLRRGSEITIVARGNGFLYKMVRSLAGFLIRVGTGELDPDTARGILDSGVRTARVPTAQPQGLFLWKVDYPTHKRPAPARMRGA